MSRRLHHITAWPPSTLFSNAWCCSRTTQVTGCWTRLSAAWSTGAGATKRREYASAGTGRGTGTPPSPCRRCLPTRWKATTSCAPTRCAWHTPICARPRSTWRATARRLLPEQSTEGGRSRTGSAGGRSATAPPRRPTPYCGRRTRSMTVTAGPHGQGHRCRLGGGCGAVHLLVPEP